MNPSEKLLNTIELADGFDSDDALRTKLGWDKLYYIQVKKQLVAEGKIPPKPRADGRAFLTEGPADNIKVPIKNQPLTFEIEEDLAHRLKRFKEDSGSSSSSAIIRTALDEFDFEQFRPRPSQNTQLSIRLPSHLKTVLKDTASLQNVSLGEVIREAIIAFLDSENLAERGPISSRPRKSPELKSESSGLDDSEEGDPWQI